MALDELAPMRDASAELVSQNCKKHVFVELEARVEPEAPVQVTEPTTTKSIYSSGTEPDLGDEMVTRWTMTIGCFVPDTRPALQQ
nr:hypothetical protein CFP56_17854 [Quercus suber]